MARGYLSIVLHAHLPFVRHPEYESFLEETWLFEAITDTYIPLLRDFEALAADGVPFRLTDDRLTMDLDGPASRVAPVEQELSRAIIEATVDEARFASGRTSLVKYLSRGA